MFDQDHLDQHQATVDTYVLFRVPGVLRRETHFSDLAKSVSDKGWDVTAMPSICSSQRNTFGLPQVETWYRVLIYRGLSARVKSDQQCWTHFKCACLWARTGGRWFKGDIRRES